MTGRPYQRLLDVALLLRNAGVVGVSTPTLLEAIGYRDTDAGKRALMRDLDDLRAVGLEIVNAQGKGDEARYVLRPGDVRLRLEFSPAQRTALQAALATVARDQRVAVEATPLPVDLDRVAEAVRARCAMRFEYNGTARIVDPLSYSWRNGDVFLVARERGSEIVKSFSIRRMLDLEIDRPGTATSNDDVERPSLDPITWLVDPPVQATLQCPGFTEDVVALLGGDVTADVVTTTVTNRLIFFARLMELGSRARLVGPEELREQLRQRLREVL
jgi:predicted DNA-binding transcriptional regulator YafY